MSCFYPDFCLPQSSLVNYIQYLLHQVIIVQGVYNVTSEFRWQIKINVEIYLQTVSDCTKQKIHVARWGSYGGAIKQSKSFYTIQQTVIRGSRNDKYLYRSEINYFLNIK